MQNPNMSSKIIELEVSLSSNLSELVPACWWPYAVLDDLPVLENKQIASHRFLLCNKHATNETPAQGRHSSNADYAERVGPPKNRKRRTPPVDNLIQLLPPTTNAGGHSDRAMR